MGKGTLIFKKEGTLIYIKISVPSFLRITKDCSTA